MHLSGVRPSVRLPVCPILRRANAGSATLSAYVGSCMQARQTRYNTDQLRLQLLQTNYLH